MKTTISTDNEIETSSLLSQDFLQQTYKKDYPIYFAEGCALTLVIEKRIFFESIFLKLKYRCSLF